MIKRALLALAAFIAIFAFFWIDSLLRHDLLEFSREIKAAVLEKKERLFHKISTLFDQSRKIEALERKVAQLQRCCHLYDDIKYRYDRLVKAHHIAFDPDGFHLKLVRMIAYKKIGDFTSAWLDAPLKRGKIYGLVGESGVAGIALDDGSGAYALFNGNKKCSYTVNIGKDTKGIATGSGDNRFVIVKYIPSFAPLKVGDRVYTNGFDNIFPYGVEVGEVVKFWQEGSYKVARVKTVEDLRQPLYFWLVWRDSNKAIK